jgi:hypothetical protein
MRGGGSAGRQGGGGVRLGYSLMYKVGFTIQIPHIWRQTNQCVEEKLEIAVTQQPVRPLSGGGVIQSVFEGSAVCVVTDSVMRVPCVG